MTNQPRGNEEQPEWMKPGYWENRPWEERLEEYGDLHGENCSCMMEDPDECDCDEMASIKDFVRKLIAQKDATINELSKTVEVMRATLKELADYSPHCCEDCPCDYFREAAEKALSQHLPSLEIHKAEQADGLEGLDA